MAHDILVVDDEPAICEVIAGILEDEGHHVRTAANSDEALALVRERKPSLAILDVWLQDSTLDGIELLLEIKASDPHMPVVVISGHGTVETAVAAIRQGAYDFIEKPFESDRLIHTVTRALEAARLAMENAELRKGSATGADLIGKSSAIQLVRQTIGKVAAANSRVLITGPAGSGKEVAARIIHEQSARAQSRFVAVTAANMAPERVERELFGEETVEGAVLRPGLFEQAHLGTLFIDEVADMPLETQGKILRTLVDQRFRRIGGTTDVEVDVRVISASSRDLEAETQAGGFRPDLYHRLNVVPLRMPALQDRREDIPMLVDHFIERLASMSGLNARPLAPDAMALLQAQDWPGNVRQLRNYVERLLILAGGQPTAPISLECLPTGVMGDGEGDAGAGAERMIALSLRDAREQFEREYLLAQINRFGGNISRTAEFIGMERSALHRKLKTLGVQAGARGEV